MTGLPDLHDRTIRLRLAHVTTGNPDGLSQRRNGLLDHDRLLLHDDRRGLLHDDWRGLLHDNRLLLHNDRLRLHHDTRRIGFHRIVNRGSDKASDKAYARPHPEVTRMPAVMMVITAAMPMVMRTIMPGEYRNRHCNGRQTQQQLSHFIISFSWAR